VDKKLIKYIRKCFKAGYSKSKVSEMLKVAGYTEEVIKEGLVQAVKPNTFRFLKFKIAPDDESPFINVEDKEEVKVEESGKKKGLTAQLNDINEKLKTLDVDKDKKVKKSFSLGATLEAQIKKLTDETRILVFLLTNNRKIIPQLGNINDGLVEVNGKFHACSMDYIFLYKGKYPAVVIPEWDLTPIGTKDYYEAMATGRNINPQQIMIRAIESKENAGAKKLNPKMLIWIILGVVVVGYILFAKG